MHGAAPSDHGILTDGAPPARVCANRRETLGTRARLETAATELAEGKLFDVATGPRALLLPSRTSPSAKLNAAI
jgi:hypothetical protein